MVGVNSDPSLPSILPERESPVQKKAAATKHTNGRPSSPLDDTVFRMMTWAMFHPQLCEFVFDSVCRDEETLTAVYHDTTAVANEGNLLIKLK